MTIKQFRKVPAGTVLTWRDDNGNITDTGHKRIAGKVHSARWKDGQETDGSDDWALEHVEEL